MGRTRSNTSFGDTGPAPKLDFEKGGCGLHGTNPSCTDFGVGYTWHVLHPSGYFCSNCRWYKNEVMARTAKKVKRDSHAYACQANHYDWATPEKNGQSLAETASCLLQKIPEEEECLQKEKVTNIRALCKRKHQAMFLFEEEDLTEEVASSSGKEATVSINETTCSNNTNKSGEITAPPFLLIPDHNANDANNHSDVIWQLRE